MNFILTDDVQKLLLTTYVPACYIPLVALSCRSVQNLVARAAHAIAKCAPSREAPGAPTLIELVRQDDNKVDLLRWIRSMRSSPSSAPTAGQFRAPSHWLSVHTQANIMSVAARHGYSATATLCFDEWGIHDIGPAFHNAARGGHIDLVRRIYLDWNKRLNIVFGLNPYSAMYYAARGGHMNILQMCLTEWHCTELCAHHSDAMVAAARGGHEDIVRLLHDSYEAWSVEPAMIAAAGKGHMHLVRLCHDEWGATNATHINSVMIFAAEGGHEEIVRVCYVEWGARDVFHALRLAASAGHEHIATFFFTTHYDIINVLKDIIRREMLAEVRMTHIIHTCRVWIDKFSLLTK